MDLNTIIRQAKEADTWLAYRKAARDIQSNLAAGEADALIKVKSAFLSSFTIEPLVDYAVVEAAADGIYLDTYVAGYRQFNQEILRPDSGLYAFAPQISFLLVEFDCLLENHTEDSSDKKSAPVAQKLLSLADVYTKNSPGTLILANFIAPPPWPMHIIPGEITTAVRTANNILFQETAHQPSIQICDLDTLAAYYGYRHTFSPEMMALARIPFSEAFCKLLAQKIVSHIKAYKNLVAKCLVMDCDNTLWGGIIGEDGFDGIHLGPDSPGREFVVFQKAILELYQQGVILAVNSKNNYNDVMQVIREHPHMVLRENHFASLQINWSDKPSNMRRIADELNIGIDSFVFLDDNPAERAMMRQMLPSIRTLELPENPSLFARTLRETNFFARPFLTDEDRRRGEIYVAQRRRQELKLSAVTFDDYLKSLKMKASIRPPTDSDINRIAQLTQRTNQFNLTTRRYTASDIAALLADKNKILYTLGLKDAFGDNGMVGLAIIIQENNIWHIDTFLMSCRVIGRQVEDALVNRILQDAADHHIVAVEAIYLRTAKNEIVADFWQKMGFQKTSASRDSSDWNLDLADFTPRQFPYLEFE